MSVGRKPNACTWRDGPHPATSAAVMWWVRLPGDHPLRKGASGLIVRMLDEIGAPVDECNAAYALGGQKAVWQYLDSLEWPRP